MPLLVNKIFSQWAPCVLRSIDNVHHIGQWICNSQFIILSVTIVLTRFRLACHGRDSTTSYLPVTVFVQDINDNPPVFQSQGERIGVFDRAMQFDIDTSPSTYSYMHKSGRKAKSSKNEHLNRHRYAPACWGVLLWRPVSPVDIRSQLETFCSVAPPPRHRIHTTVHYTYTLILGMHIHHSVICNADDCTNAKLFSRYVVMLDNVMYTDGLTIISILVVLLNMLSVLLWCHLSLLVTIYFWSACKPRK